MADAAQRPAAVDSRRAAGQTLDARGLPGGDSPGLRMVIRLLQERAEEPTAAVLNGRTLQSSPESGTREGYDGYKRKKDSKTHVAVDTPGNLLAVAVTPASEQERAQVDNSPHRCKRPPASAATSRWNSSSNLRPCLLWLFDLAPVLRFSRTLCGSGPTSRQYGTIPEGQTCAARLPCRSIHTKCGRTSEPGQDHSS